MYVIVCVYIWANYNDLTATSLESWITRGIIPKWPYFRSVNYYNLPRYIYIYTYLDLDPDQSHKESSTYLENLGVHLPKTENPKG